jgi:hypothetical protein
LSFETDPPLIWHVDLQDQRSTGRGESMQRIDEATALTEVVDADGGVK